MAMAGAAQLKPIYWRACVLDEAHKLKNKGSKIAEILKSFNLEHRVLLTGTPLQNSLNELWALLNFLDPANFPSEAAFMTEYGSLKNSTDVEKLQLLLKPLMLRRLKEDVEKSIPVKEETVIEVELTHTQKKWYRAILERNFSMLKRGARRESMPSLINIVMELRKCCIHPYLLHGAEDCIIEEAGAQNSPEDQYTCMINASGKLVLLDKLLRKLKAGGHKVLIFSQMTRCLDILADYLRGQRHLFERIDGAIRGADRQAAIDRFCAPDSNIFIFLLCTRAGGVGINLTAADTAIIFDSDWNPQSDLQAQARCHRIGQKKPVQIYRLITRNTYEKEMFDRAGFKLGLDKAILQRMDASGVFSSSDEPVSRLSNSEIEDLLKKGAYGAFLDDSETNAFCEEDIEQILNKRTTVIKHDSSAATGSIFSKATFSSGQNNEIDVNDPLFWDKVAERANLAVQDNSALLQVGLGTYAEPRQRRSHARATDQIRDTSAQYVDDEEREEDVREIFEDAARWSPTEKLYFERRLMVFGVYHWGQLQKTCPRRSINDLRVCARDLLRFLISKLDPETDQVLIADCEAAVASECDPYCLPEGDPLPYEGATPRQVTEYRSFLIAAPQEYRDMVEKKARFMLSRVQLLKQVHDLVPREINLARETIIVPPLTRPPASWWGPIEDRDLLIGVVRHGYHSFKQMLTDPDLVFRTRRYEPASLMEKLHRRRQYGGSSARKRNQEDHSDDQDEDDPMNANDDEDIAEFCRRQAQGGDGQPLVAWPSKSEVGSRLRRVVGIILREKKRLLDPKSENGINESCALPRDRLGRLIKRSGIAGFAGNMAADPNSRFRNGSPGGDDNASKQVAKWSKRERTDFYRALCAHGVYLAEDESGGLALDWARIRDIAHLICKPDATLDEYYSHLIALSYHVIDSDAVYEKDVTCQRPVERWDGDEEITPEKAKKLLKRIEFMDYLRRIVLRRPHLEKILDQAKRTPGLPAWWMTGSHDRALLFAVAKHGYGRYESIVQDPEFIFYFLAQNHANHDAYTAQNKSALCVVGGLPWPKESIINKRIESLCRLAAPRFVLKQDPLHYVPPCYAQPELEESAIDLSAPHPHSPAAYGAGLHYSPSLYDHAGAPGTHHGHNHDGIYRQHGTSGIPDGHPRQLRKRVLMSDAEMTANLHGGMKRSCVAARSHYIAARDGEHPHGPSSAGARITIEAWSPGGTSKITTYSLFGDPFAYGSGEPQLCLRRIAEFIAAQAPSPSDSNAVEIDEISSHSYENAQTIDANEAMSGVDSCDESEEGLASLSPCSSLDTLSSLRSHTEDCGSSQLASDCSDGGEFDSLSPGEHSACHEPAAVNGFVASHHAVEPFASNHAPAIQPVPPNTTSMLPTSTIAPLKIRFKRLVAPQDMNGA